MHTSPDPPGNDVLSSGSDRAPVRPPRALLVGTAGAALVVTAVALWVTARPPEPAPAAPAVRVVAPVPVVSTSAAPPRLRPSSRLAHRARTDLATTVSTARVTVPGTGVEQQIALVSQRLTGAGVTASVRYLPAPGPPPGVQVQFDRRLDTASAQAFLAALAALPGATTDLEDEPGTTVDVSVPAVPGATCLPDATAPASVVLPPTDLDVVARALGIFGLGADGGTVTVSYTGPQLIPADLDAVRAALVHGCGASPAATTTLRHVDEG